MPFFTIGHSTRSIAEFAELLRASQVELVVDVRHMPRSRTNPQFNREILPDELKSFQIGYVHLAALGGLRSRGLETSPNLLWQNISFRNYADYAMTEDFHHGLTELRNLGHEAPFSHHVCRSRLVAMPSADNRGLSHLRRRECLPHSRQSR